MSTAARKARRRAGEKFLRVPKVGTPLEERAIPQVWKKGSNGVLGWYPSNRALRKVADRLKAIGNGGDVA